MNDMTSDISTLILCLLVVFVSFQVFLNVVNADVVCDIIDITYFRDRILLLGQLGVRVPAGNRLAMYIHDYFRRDEQYLLWNVCCSRHLGSLEWSCIPSVNFGMSNTSSLFNRHFPYLIKYKSRSIWISVFDSVFFVILVHLPFFLVPALRPFF